MLARIGKKPLVIVFALSLVFSLVSAGVAVAAETRMTMVVMGDSYSSGTGATNYYGTAGCYRSYGNYAAKLANKIKSTGVDVEYYNVACHGAVSKDLVGQIHTLNSRVRSQVDLVVMTIGGNDGGFEEVVTQCLVGITDNADKCHDAVGTAFDLAPKIKSNIMHRLEEIAVLMPDARIVLMGYPYPVSRSGSCKYEHTTDAGHTFSARDQIGNLADLMEAAQIQAIKALNAEYSGRFKFVSVKPQFAGHEVCGDKSNWLRGDFDTPLVWEWFHPNAEGYQAEANILYSAGVHKGVTDTFAYTSLPFTCGYEVKYATTYDSTVVNGKTYVHGKAIDLPVPSGTVVTAPVSGTAYSKYDPGGFGHYVEIHGSDGRVHRMAHMIQSGIIGDGVRVSKGQKVGYSGSTGASTGPHVHYEQLVSGIKVTPVLGGPALEWGTSQGSDGDRKTLHTLESKNCSVTNTATSSYSGDELLFYNKQTGRSLLYASDTKGNTRELSRHIWSTGWDIIVPFEIDGTSGSELIYYNREATSTRGKAVVYNVTARGLAGALKTHNWSNYWTHFVPIDIDGDKLDELLVYSAMNGRFYFLDIAKDGSAHEIRGGTWSAGWWHIVALEFDGTRGQELLFYKNGSSRSVTAFYDVSSSGGISRRATPGWVNNWSHIIPADLNADGTDELIVYRDKDGKYFFLDLRKDGSPTALKSGNWKAGWDHIMALEVDGTKGSEMLFYDSGYSSTGLGAIYDANTNGLGNKFAQYNWSKNWEFILPLQLTK